MLKLALINEYKLSMGGVVVKDKYIYHATTTPPAKKYWLKIVDNFLDIFFRHRLLNAYIVFKYNTDNPMDRYNFAVEIVVSLLEMMTHKWVVPLALTGLRHQISTFDPGFKFSLK